MTPMEEREVTKRLLVDPIATAIKENAKAIIEINKSILELSKCVDKIYIVLKTTQTRQS